MSKIFIFFIILLSLIISLNCYHQDDYYDVKEYEEEVYGDDEDDEETGYGPFRQTLKDYLTKHNLTNSDKIIKPKRLRKLFLRTIGASDLDSIPKSVREIYEETASYFIEKFYNNTDEIRGRDVYKLFDFEEISLKFNEIYQKNPPRDDDKDKPNDRRQEFEDDMADYDL